MRSKITKEDFFEIVSYPIASLILVLFCAMLETISFFHFTLSPKFREKYIEYLRAQKWENRREEDFDEYVRINKKENFYKKINNFLTKKTPI